MENVGLNYLNTGIKEVSKDDLKKALEKIRKQNKAIRDSYKTLKDVGSFRVI